MSVPDPAAARSGAAHRLDALYERAETAKANHDAGRRILQDLMDELAALAAARLAHQQEIDELKQQTYPAYKREKALRCAAEAALTALRQDLQALRRYQAGEFIIGGRRPHPDGEFVKWNDLTDRLAREESPTTEQKDRE